VLNADKSGRSPKAYLILSPQSTYPKLPAPLGSAFYQIKLTFVSHPCFSDSRVSFDVKPVPNLFLRFLKTPSTLLLQRGHQKATIMAAMLGAAGGGDIGALPLEQWFFEMPVCTRWWTTATVVTGLLVQCHILTPFQLFYSFRAVFVRSQVYLSSFLHPSA
jgi:hypothetical protein